MFNIIKSKDLEPYASGLRWYKVTAVIDMQERQGDRLLAIQSDDVPLIGNGQSNPQLPSMIKGFTAINMYEMIYLTNFVITGLKVIPDREAIIESAGGAGSYPTNIPWYFNGNIREAQFSQIDLVLDSFGACPVMEFYVQGYVIDPEQELDTGEL